jgi:predicted transcriptional regulator/DNA-binding XRE family transcriptional regulator
MTDTLDALLIGRHIRDLRTERGMTLDTLAAAIDRAPSQVSALENGKRAPRITQLQQIATALGVTLDELLRTEPKTDRTAKELEIERAQRTGLYTALGIPNLRLGKGLNDQVLDTILGLQKEVERLHQQRAATPEEARRANAELRQQMRDQNNYYPALEAQARELLDIIGYNSGPLSERLTAELANRLGFTLHYVSDLPVSTRSVTDSKNGRIFLPMRRAGRDERTGLLRALAAHVLQHKDPVSYSDYLTQRVESNYLAGALLLPESSAVSFLQEAKAQRELAVEDLRDFFAVGYEVAAHRFTNLATQHLELPVHFAKVHQSGTLAKAYENDNVSFPADVFGAVEGQLVCRNWSARRVFTVEDRFTPYHQYTDKPTGTYWCTSRIESSAQGEFSVSVGTTFSSVKWFRGRDTTTRFKSDCPDPSCCRQAPDSIEDKWGDSIQPLPRINSSLLAAMPRTGIMGIDKREVLEFLEAHEPQKAPQASVS